VLRADKKAEIVRLPWSIHGRYALQSGGRLFDERWRGRWFQLAAAEQLEDPVHLLEEEGRSYWWFHDRIWWEDDDLSDLDVKALVLQRERTDQRRLRNAHSLMRAEESAQVRERVPLEIRRFVYERDGGRCLGCGSGFDLQYDHVLPVARGGATTVENLQLLCGDCNRRKSDSL
jgi:5-methylcytosine-specific restriction endonuclease McrA